MTSVRSNGGSFQSWDEELGERKGISHGWEYIEYLKL